MHVQHHKFSFMSYKIDLPWSPLQGQESYGTIRSRGQKFTPSNVWPNCQLPGAASVEMATDPSLVMALNESACPFILLLPVNCHIDPQLRFIASQGVLLPLMYICCTSPAPATFVTSTNINQGFPLMVNRIPPAFKHGTLNTSRMNIVSARTHSPDNLKSASSIDTNI